MSGIMNFLRRLQSRYEEKQLNVSEEKEESYYFRESEPVIEEEETMDSQDGEYEILEREIAPRKIKCPDCGGLTLEGLEFCDKCGGELIYRD